jgi:hypothetical protein
MKGDWNGTGAHTNFSTESMRKPGGMDVIMKAIDKLSKTHAEHISQYGTGNEQRLTGKHETCDINTFRSGVADRGSSIRIPLPVQLKGYGEGGGARPGIDVGLDVGLVPPADGGLQRVPAAAALPPSAPSSPNQPLRLTTTLPVPHNPPTHPHPPSARLPGGPPPRRQRGPLHRGPPADQDHHQELSRHPGRRARAQARPPAGRGSFARPRRAAAPGRAA